jgi:hypothetical protein
MNHRKGKSQGVFHNGPYPYGMETIEAEKYVTSVNLPAKDSTKIKNGRGRKRDKTEKLLPGCS